MILSGGSKNKIHNWHKKYENMKYELETPRLCCFIYLGLIVLKFYSFALVYVLAIIYLAGGHHLICGGHDILCGHYMLYGGHDMLCGGHDMPCGGHDILCGGHYIAKSWP